MRGRYVAEIADSVAREFVVHGRIEEHGVRASGGSAFGVLP